jgi:hypothetical protein
LRAVGGEIGKAEAAIDRYLDAFEAGTLREQQCGWRVQALTAKLVEFKTRQDELRDLLDTAHDPTPDPQALAELLEPVRAAVRHGPLPVRTSLVETLVEEIRVHSRGHIVPVFRLPNGRHRPDGAVGPGEGWVVGPEPPLRNHELLVARWRGHVWVLDRPVDDGAAGRQLRTLLLGHEGYLLVVSMARTRNLPDRPAAEISRTNSSPRRGAVLLRSTAASPHLPRRAPSDQLVGRFDRPVDPAAWAPCRRQGRRKGG